MITDDDHHDSQSESFESRRESRVPAHWPEPRARARPPPPWVRDWQPETPLRTWPGRGRRSRRCRHFDSEPRLSLLSRRWPPAPGPGLGHRDWHSAMLTVTGSGVRVTPASLSPGDRARRLPPKSYSPGPGPCSESEVRCLPVTRSTTLIRALSHRDCDRGGHWHRAMIRPWHRAMILPGSWPGHESNDSSEHPMMMPGPAGPGPANPGLRLSIRSADDDWTES